MSRDSRLADSALEWPLGGSSWDALPRTVDVEELEVVEDRSLSPRKPNLFAACPCSALLPLWKKPSRVGEGLAPCI